jgi:hypothetical protein
MRAAIWLSNCLVEMFHHGQEGALLLIKRHLDSGELLHLPSSALVHVHIELGGTLGFIAVGRLILHFLIGSLAATI